jgi:8-oxo-dGTP pyrophosphatase MutT (NUDIX family)
MDVIELPESVKRVFKMGVFYANIIGYYLWQLACDFAIYAKSRGLKFYKAHLKKCEFVYRGVRVTTDRSSIRPCFETICKAPKFLNWLDKFPLDKFDLRTVNLTDVDFFGSSSNPEKLGFLKFKCDVFTKMGEPLDGIVFLRGDCGAVLIIVEDENGKESVLLTEQPRIPSGVYKEEIVSGMFDALTGCVAVNDVLKKEIQEETGLVLNVGGDNYTRLGEYTLSGGGCDEKVHLAVFIAQLESEKIEEMKAKQFGEQGTNEKIRLKFYPVETFEKELLRISDAKTSLAWLLYKGIPRDAYA